MLTVVVCGAEESMPGCNPDALHRKLVESISAIKEMHFAGKDQLFITFALEIEIPLEFQVVAAVQPCLELPSVCRKIAEAVLDAMSDWFMTIQINWDCSATLTVIVMEYGRAEKLRNSRELTRRLPDRTS